MIHNSYRPHTTTSINRASRIRRSLGSHVITATSPPISEVEPRQVGTYPLRLEAHSSILPVPQLEPHLQGSSSPFVQSQSLT